MCYPSIINSRALPNLLALWVEGARRAVFYDVPGNGQVPEMCFVSSAIASSYLLGSRRDHLSQFPQSDRILVS